MTSTPQYAENKKICQITDNDGTKLFLIEDGKHFELKKVAVRSDNIPGYHIDTFLPVGYYGVDVSETGAIIDIAERPVRSDDMPERIAVIDGTGATVGWVNTEDQAFSAVRPDELFANIKMLDAKVDIPDDKFFSHPITAQDIENARQKMIDTPPAEHKFHYPDNLKRALKATGFYEEEDKPTVDDVMKNMTVTRGDGVPLPDQKQALEDFKNQARSAVRSVDKLDLDEATYDGMPATIKDLEDVIKDYRRLTREIDIALNGVDGAAKQASLCDILSQIESSNVVLFPKIKPRFTIERNFNGRWIVYDTKEQEPYQTWDHKEDAETHANELNDDILTHPVVKMVEEMYAALNNSEKWGRKFRAFKAYMYVTQEWMKKDD